ncbi:MAG: DUF2179 domain-containing protein, partial [Bacteroidales bacterium]|nr:DUF2179 domain-containing protein [Bacteroidales bacterium]
MENLLLPSVWFDFGVLPLLIILARVCDVSLNTLRIIYLAKGYKLIVPILGFFEVLIWLLAVTRIFENLDNWLMYIAYPLGFALGNYVGMKLEERLAIGVELIRIITKKDARELIQALRGKGFSVTALQAEGSQGEVGILYSIINRKNLQEYVALIKEFNPNAFYTIEDVRFVSHHLADT